MITPVIDNSHKTSLEQHVICPECDSFVWNLQVSFDAEDWTIAAYFTEMSCANCGLHARAPMEADMLKKKALDGLA